jgi:histidine triad (HIT) family protein
MSSSPSIFTRIVAREIPASIVFENDEIIAFNDIAPQAPVHILIVPKTEAYATVAELAEGDPRLLAHIVEIAQQLADSLTDGQFRLIFNTGEAAGQTIFHVHAHLLGGRLEEGTLAS